MLAQNPIIRYNNYMLVIDMISWWYLTGWNIFVRKLFTKLGDTADFFSIRSLLKTLFAPFRQISAGTTASSALDARLRAWADRTFSRLIGAVVRLFLILLGGIILLLQLIFSLVAMILWPVLPFAPVVFVFMAMMGVTL